MAKLYHEHTGPLVDARHYVGDPVPVEQLAIHAVAALTSQHSLAHRALHSTWVNVVTRLPTGASLELVAAAIDLEVDEVRVGLGSWADGQLRHAG